MISLSGTSLRQFKQLNAELKNLEKQQGFATRSAMGRLGKRLVDEERATVLRVFDRPQTFTSGKGAAFFNVQMRSSAGTYTRVIGMKDIQSRYLRPNVEGGNRQVKRFERALTFKDLSRNLFGSQKRLLVPARDLELNKHGNLTPAKVRQLLTGVQKGGGKNSKYFIGRAGRGNRTVALWERQPLAAGKRKKGRKIKPILVAVARTSYRKRFDFYGIAERRFEKDWADEFEKALEQALRTAKRS